MPKRTLAWSGLSRRFSKDYERLPAMAEAMKPYPDDYHPQNRHKRQVPDAVAKDNIVLAHSLLGCFFYGAFTAKMLVLRADTPAWP